MIRHAILVCAAVGALYAHHSGALYDSKRTEIVHGTVKAFLWMNPHVVLLLTAEPNGDRQAGEWRIEMTSPARLTRAGWSKRSLKSGDVVAVDYNPMRDNSRVGWARKVVLSDGKVLDFDAVGVEKPNLP